MDKNIKKKIELKGRKIESFEIEGIEALSNDKEMKRMERLKKRTEREWNIMKARWNKLKARMDRDRLDERIYKMAAERPFEFGSIPIKEERKQEKLTSEVPSVEEETLNVRAQLLEELGGLEEKITVAEDNNDTKGSLKDKMQKLSTKKDKGDVPKFTEESSKTGMNLDSID